MAKITSRPDTATVQQLDEAGYALTRTVAELRDLLDQLWDDVNALPSGSVHTLNGLPLTAIPRHGIDSSAQADLLAHIHCLREHCTAGLDAAKAILNA